MSNLKALRPNIGFLLRQPPGYSRKMDIEYPDAVKLAQDLVLERLNGVLEMTRTQQGIWVTGKLDCGIEAACARCLEPFSNNLQVRLEEMFYYPPSKAMNPTDYRIAEDGTMNLVGPIREQLLIAIPIRALCRPDCKGLCIHCGQNLNEGECDCQEQVIDPRMAELLKLKMQFKD
ncbi:MAG: DUF177 domain-containing protein [Anaerolineales bacterium]|nr:DUF177 domain-containing protein [Anaerolineales bacterium]